MTETIGSLETALKLLKYFDSGLNIPEPSEKRAPAGFRFIGIGCYRAAYLEKATGIVYKLGDRDANQWESENAQHLIRKSTKSLDFQLRIPRTVVFPGPAVQYGEHMYDTNVAAQEYAANAKPTYCDAMETWKPITPKCSCKQIICYSHIHDSIAEFSGLDDIHSHNILKDDRDVFWLIDLAS